MMHGFELWAMTKKDKCKVEREEIGSSRSLAGVIL
jgi:hypothetical protein